MKSSSNRFFISFNGEIYNFLELRSELNSLGISCRSDSDTEVLLELLSSVLNHHRPSDSLSIISSFLRRLNGIFAFALWDSLHEELLLVRDAFGVKPLYILNIHDTLFFSSEIKAFTDIPPGLDSLSVDNYLTYLWCPGSGTLSESVRKVKPGEAIVISKGKVICRSKWYSLPFSNPGSKYISSSKSLLISSTRKFLQEAVHRQMVSDVPVGAFLSGGLDSSSIVAFARQINPDLQCFTIDSNQSADDGFVDDLPYARSVAHHLGVPLNVIKTDSSSLVSGLEKMIWHLDEPLADPACLNVFYISQLAKDQGIKVLLSGTGGDDLFTGYRRHFALQAEGLWSWLPAQIRTQMFDISSNFSTRVPIFRRLRKAFSGAHLDDNSRLVQYFRWINRPDLSSLYSKDFLNSIQNSLSEDPLIDFLSTLPSDVSRLQQMLLLEQNFFLPDHNLTYTDKMGMASSVEIRVPFLDCKLVDFASQIPLKYKQRGTTGKWILKKAMQTYLPHNIIYRPKSGFGAPLRGWLVNELDEWLADLLCYDAIINRGIFNPISIQQLIVDNREGRIDASYTLFSIACIELWSRFFLDRNFH